MVPQKQQSFDYSGSPSSARLAGGRGWRGVGVCAPPAAFCGAHLLPEHRSGRMRTEEVVRV